MRYGTRTNLKRRWTRQGKRPSCKMKIGYQWGWLYVALCPFTGDLFALYCSNLDKDCFKYFNEALLEHLKKQGIKKDILMIGDGATAHAKDAFPEQIKWEKLPTACPELNPVERFFEELRKVLSNRIFSDTREVEECLTFWVKQYQQNPEKLIKLTKFKWFDNAK